jgi:hypothetical protein
VKEVLVYPVSLWLENITPVYHCSKACFFDGNTNPFCGKKSSATAQSPTKSGEIGVKYLRLC